jgi:hypothetical protein
MLPIALQRVLTAIYRSAHREDHQSALYDMFIEGMDTRDQVLAKEMRDEVRFTVHRCVHNSTGDDQCMAACRFG